MAIRESGRRFGETVGDRDIRAEFKRQRHARGVRIESEHAAAVGLQQLDGEQADESKAHHDDSLAERRNRETDALHRDRAERDEARVLVIDISGDRNRQVFRDCVDFRVIRKSSAGAGEPIADRDATDATADLQNFAGKAVSKRDRRIELREHFFDRRLQAVALDIAHDATHQIGARHGLSGERGLGEIDQLPFGARTDERDARRHEQTAFSDPRSRRFRDLEFTRSIALHDLFHVF